MWGWMILLAAGLTIYIQTGVAKDHVALATEWVELHGEGSGLPYIAWKAISDWAPATLRDIGVFRLLAVAFPNRFVE